MVYFPGMYWALVCRVLTLSKVLQNVSKQRAKTVIQKLLLGLHLSLNSCLSGRNWAALFIIFFVYFFSFFRRRGCTLTKGNNCGHLSATIWENPGANTNGSHTRMTVQSSKRGNCVGFGNQKYIVCYWIKEWISHAPATTNSYKF